MAVPKDRRDGRQSGQARTAQCVQGDGVLIRSCSLRGIVRPEPWPTVLVLGCGLCPSLITAVSERGKFSEKVLMTYTHSAYGTNQMSKRCCHFIKVSAHELSEGCIL